MNEKKLVAWVEVPALDFQRAVKFYEAILDVKMNIFEDENEKMACFPTGEGAISYTKGFAPSENGVLVSFNLENNLEKCLNLLPSLGGSVVIPKTKIEVEGKGWFAVAMDCEGNKIGFYGE